MENPQVKIDGKFMSVWTPANLIQIIEIKFYRSKTYGTTYQINFRIQLPEIQTTEFICKTNTLYKRDYKEKYHKTPSDVIGMIADFLDIQRNDFKETIRTCKASPDSAKNILQKHFQDQGERICKIDSTILPNTEGTTLIFGVQYADEEIRQCLKEDYGMIWDKDQKAWKGDLNNIQVGELLEKYGDHIYTSSIQTASVVPKHVNPRAKVFNFATEKHVTVPFTEIRLLIERELHRQIVKIDTPNNEFIPSKIEQLYNEGKVVEFMEQGHPIWEYKAFTRTIDVNSQPISFVGMVRIESGDNTKRNSIKFIAYIKVGSCDNSIREATKESVYHTKDWEERAMQYLHSSEQLLDQAMQVIQMAINTPISLDDAIKYIKSLSFGLKDSTKIEQVQGLLITRLQYEYQSNQTKWALSQALTYVGSHTDEYAQHLQQHEIGDTIYPKLQEEGYNALQNP